MDLRSRSKFNDYFKPVSMSYKRLPTYIDVYLHSTSIKSKNIASAVFETVERIRDIWFRASIPTFNPAYIRTKVNRYLVIINKIKKSINSVN